MLKSRKAVFITPIVPADSGNGLAMRAGMFVEALSRIARVDVIVVPVAGGPVNTTPFLQSLGVGVHVVPVEGRYETRFLLLSQIKDPQTRLEAFRAYGKPSLASFLSVPVLARIAEIIQECAPDLVHIGRSYLEPCATLLAEHVVATVDLDEDDLMAYTSQAGLARNEGRPGRADWLIQEGRACDSLIARFGPRFERAFVSSRREALLLARRHPGLKLEVVENAVAIPERTAKRDDGATLMFLGSLSYPPNAEGILWFSRQILPRLKALGGPSFRLLIAGAQPPPAVLALGRHPRVSVLGYVPDVAELYRRSTIALAPLKAGGGTRIKLLEAAAHGVVSVSTPFGAEGLHWPTARNGWVAATAGEFAGACREALASRAERSLRAAHALDWVRRHHAKKALVARISRSLANCHDGTANEAFTELHHE